LKYKIQGSSKGSIELPFLPVTDPAKNLT